MAASVGGGQAWKRALVSTVHLERLLCPSMIPLLRVGSSEATVPECGPGAGSGMPDPAPVPECGSGPGIGSGIPDPDPAPGAGMPDPAPASEHRTRSWSRNPDGPYGLVRTVSAQSAPMTRSPSA